MQFIKSAVAGYETSPYKVNKTYENGVEERIYSAKKWATTEKVVSGTSLDDIKSEMFFALFGYITGKNEKSQKIAMTIPVSTKVENLPEDKISYQVGFYIPEEFQQDPPKPTDDRVSIKERDLRVYTITFGGFANGKQYEEKYQELLNFLTNQGIKPAVQHDNQEPIYYRVGYDSPAKFWNRKNEVWIQAE